MVIVGLRSGLGNQLFQYAFARNLAVKLNTDLKIDLTECNKNKASHHEYYRLGEFNIQENFAEANELANIKGDSWKIFDKQITPLKPNDNVYVTGNWMFSEPYFKDVSDIIRREFTLKNPIGETSSLWRKKILTAECAVSMHIRLGDYLIPQTRNTSWGQTLSMDYYMACVETLKKMLPNMTLFVFSDDIGVARQILNFDVPMEFVEGCEHDFEEMYLISLCKHNIIAGSTFSFWSAWLNQNPEKKIFTPSNYVPMQNCIVVNVDQTKNPLIKMPPALSIIIRVDNDVDKFQTPITSILSQSINDYELIILYAGTNDSETTYRQLVLNSNVTFIKVNPKTTRYEAWNKGLDCARGDYVFFLSDSDFIFPNTISLFVGIGWDYYGKYTKPRGIHVNYDTYEQTYVGNLANIFCSTQRIEEDANGTLQVNGIADKKFSILVDAIFKDLNELQEITLDDNQKLMLLGSGQINHLLGTKFFKRKFLNEHKIRFDEHKQGGGLRIKISHRRFFIYREYNFRPATFLRAA